MAITEAFAGTEAVGATEWSCPRDLAYDTGQAQTDDGVYQVFIDVNGMVVTNVLQIRVYEKAQSGGTQRVIYEHILSQTQAEPLWVSPTLILLHGWDVTLKAISGTITVLWSIRKVA